MVLHSSKLGFAGKRKINPKEKLSLMAEPVCSSCPPGSVFDYEWSIYNIHDIGNKYKFKNASAMVATSLAQTFLVVNENALQFLDTCMFRVEVWLPPATTRGFAELSRAVNRPPFGGRCSMTPASGYAFFTDFALSCSGYLDKDEPLMYYVFFKESPDGLKNGPILSTDKQTDTVKLPLGKKIYNYTIYILVQVTDKEGAVTEESLMVKVIDLIFTYKICLSLEFR